MSPDTAPPAGAAPGGSTTSLTPFTRTSSHGILPQQDPFATPTASRPPSVRHPRPQSFTSTITASSTGSTGSIGSAVSAVHWRPNTSPNTSSYPKGILRPSSRPHSRQSMGPVVEGEATIPPVPARPKVPRMPSHMVPEGSEFPKPWLSAPHHRATFSYYLVYFMIALGAIGGAVQTYFDYKHVELDRKPLCLVFEEGFDDNDAGRVFGEVGSTGGTFFREVNLNGFGNGEFEMTTASQNNSFLQNGNLYLVPTLTSEHIGTDAVLGSPPTMFNATGCTFNLTAPNNGYITNTTGQRVFDWDGYLNACSAVSNATAGTVINPVQSARVTTRFSASIKFGRVEVRAKMPVGDWLWPAIWMLPVNSVYGPWPLSGEIDIVESRGNGIRYTARGSNYVQGSLNWGLSRNLNGVSKTYSWWKQRRRSFSDDFHTYALEWTEDFLRIYVDTRLHTLLDLRFNKPFFKRGEFPEVVYNGSTPVAAQNPWINGTNATPFDQDFYLILDVATGGTNGWFPDGQGTKPWLNLAANPMRDFATGIAQWYPTWPSTAADRGMVVDYVKMWKHC